jgi:hypothetical protein
LFEPYNFSFELSNPFLNRKSNRMLSSTQMKAARALFERDPRALAEAVGTSLPTVQRMEASEQNVRGGVDTLIKALECGGVVSAALRDRQFAAQARPRHAPPRPKPS